MYFFTVMHNLADYFSEVKSLKEAGIDIHKLDAHKRLYDMHLQNLIGVFGLNETIAMVNQAYAGKVSQKDLEVLYDLLYPITDETNVPFKEEEPDRNQVESKPEYEAPTVMYTVSLDDHKKMKQASEESEPETTCSGKKCAVPEKEVKPVFTSKFYVNGEEVTKDEYKKALKAHNENAYRHNHFVGDDWFMRNIFGF